MADYKTIRGTATFEYEEKRSRFIATASFADTEEKALAVLNAVRAANRTARHNVYAYVLQNGPHAVFRRRRTRQDRRYARAGDHRPRGCGGCDRRGNAVFRRHSAGYRRAGARLHGGSLGALQSAELVSMRLVVDCKVRVSYAQFEQAQRIIAAAETRLDEPILTMP